MKVFTVLLVAALSTTAVVAQRRRDRSLNNNNHGLFLKRQGYARPELPEEDDGPTVSWDDQPAYVPTRPPIRNTDVAPVGRVTQRPVPQPSPPRPQPPPTQRPQPQHHGDDYDDPANWRLEDSIPGKPESDYPTLTVLPQTSFDCKGQLPGYYADPEARCQVFHVCEESGKKNSFLCPVGTIFNQQHFVCDWWSNVDCNSAQSYYSLNSELYKEPERREQPRPQQPAPRPVQNTGVLSQGRTTPRYSPDPVTRPVYTPTQAPRPAPVQRARGSYSNDFDDAESNNSQQRVWFIRH